jgi:hypothetical protein
MNALRTSKRLMRSLYTVMLDVGVEARVSLVLELCVRGYSRPVETDSACRRRGARAWCELRTGGRLR